jgi:hypothetical protein
MTVFPNGKHDDQVDSTAQFLHWFKTPMPYSGLFEYYRREAKAAEQRRQPQPAHTVPQPGSVEMVRRRANANEPPVRRLLSGKHNFDWPW